MNPPEDLNEEEIKDGDLLNLANNILSLLDYSRRLDNEEDLFSDDFYVKIIGNLLSDKNNEMTPGETLEQKAEIMNQLIKTLSSIVEVDLGDINGAAIILEHDRISAKNLLDIIYEIIKTIIDNNLEEGEIEEEIVSNEKKKVDKNKNSNLNLSDNNVLNKNIEIEEEDSELNKKMEENDEINDEDVSIVKSQKKKYSKVEDIPNKILINNSNSSKEKNIKEKEEEEEEVHSSMKIDNSSNKKELLDYHTNKARILVESSLNKMNGSCFEQLDFQKLMNNFNNLENNADNSYIRKTYSQNDINLYMEYKERNQENEDMNNTDDSKIKNNKRKDSDNLDNEILFKHDKENSYKDKNMNNSNTSNVEKEKNKSKNSNDDNDNSSNSKKKYSNNEEREIICNVSSSNRNSAKNIDKESTKNKNLVNKEIFVPTDNEINSESKSANSVPPAYNKPRINTPSQSQEILNYEEFDYDQINKINSKITSNDYNSNNKVEKSNNEEEEEIELNYDEIKRRTSSNQKSSKVDSSIKKGKTPKTNSSNINKKSSSKKYKKNDSKISDTNKSNRDMNKKPSSKNASKINEESKNEKENGKENETENQSLFDDTIKYEIMKEFRKIYGNKLDNLFLKYNTEISQNSIDLALRNIKLSRDNMVKLGIIDQDEDDKKTIEYLQKYQKEFDSMLKFYSKQQRRSKYVNERYLKNIDQNMKYKKKIQEIDQMKTNNEIERRMKAKEIKSFHNRLKFCNNIYKEALAYEKEKNLAEKKYQKEMMKKENEEKKIVFLAVEKYYKDQIKMLKEILDKEKKERDSQFREHMIYLNKLEREDRQEYKRQLTEIFERFDEEERIEEYESNQKGDIKKIFDAYYSP